MKKESLEDELKLLKLDIVNLIENLSKVENDINSKIENIKDNLEILMNINKLNWRNKYLCNKCDGTGIKYVSPISDYEGNTNKCNTCHGKGYIIL